MREILIPYSDTDRDLKHNNIKRDSSLWLAARYMLCQIMEPMNLCF